MKILNLLVLLAEQVQTKQCVCVTSAVFFRTYVSVSRTCTSTSSLNHGLFYFAVCFVNWC